MIAKRPKKTQNIKNLDTISKVADPRKHEYRVKRDFKYRGQIYRRGDAVSVQGKILQNFIKNNYIYG